MDKAISGFMDEFDEGEKEEMKFIYEIGIKNNEHEWVILREYQKWEDISKYNI